MMKIVITCFFIGLGVLFGFWVFWFLQTDKVLVEVVPSVLPQQKVTASGFPKDSKNTWTLLVTGDVIPARVVNQKMVEKQDFMWPLRNISHLLSNADVTLINLESPLIADCPVTNEGFKFCGEDDFSRALADSGVDVANLANNHTLNYGWEGLRQTEQHLKAAGIVTTGFVYEGLECKQEINCSKLEIKTVRLSSSSSESQTSREVTLETVESSRLRSNNNILVGFLGYNAVGQRVDRPRVAAEIAKADKIVDVLVVSVHWGKEYERTPATDGIAQDDPKELGRLFIDSGADVVVGNHPHWYQGIEWYLDKPVFYALGNTVFDQEWSPETKVGYLAKLTFNGSELNWENIEIFPIGIRDYGEAYLLTGEEKTKVLEFVASN